MDPVDPHVDVVGAGQRAGVEGPLLVLPLRRQPGDGRGRQARAGAQELLERRTEVAARQTMQIQQRQNLRDLSRLARPGGQDRRAEPQPLAGGLIDALVVDSRRPDRHRARRRHHLPRRVGAVAHHQPTTVGIELIGVRIDVGSDLGLQRGGEHLPGPLTHQRVEQLRTRRRGPVTGLSGFPDYLEHGRTFPNQRANAGPDQNCLGFRSSSGRCAPSRHLAEAHPQVPIIAPGRPCLRSAGRGRQRRATPPPTDRPPDRR
jgi:hypothetical protein